MVNLDALSLAILILAAYRITRFFVFDSLMGFNLASGSSAATWLDGWAYDEEGEDRSFLRGKVGDLLACPFCLGFWISAGLWLLWLAGPATYDSPAVAFVEIFAIAGGQALLSSRLNA